MVRTYQEPVGDDKIIAELQALVQSGNARARDVLEVFLWNKRALEEVRKNAKTFLEDTALSANEAVETEMNQSASAC